MAERKQQAGYARKDSARKDEGQTDYADPTQALSHYLDDLLQSATETEAETPAHEVSAEVAPHVERVAELAPVKPAEVEPQSNAPVVAEADEAPRTLQAPVAPRVSQKQREDRRQRAREKAERVRAKRLAAANAASDTAPVALKSEPAVQPPAPPAERQSAHDATIESKAIETENPAPQLSPEGRPQWAESAFECLLFRVAGLQLAVPLVLLGAIHRVESDIRELPGSPEWFMGILSTPQTNLRVVNTAKWVMPGRVPATAESDYKFVIRLDDSEWGLACDDVAQSFRLDPDAVRWRSERSRRPWLAGTVIDHMCALVDVRTMSGMLSRAEKEQRLDISG